jgi:uncharacterized protein (DUF433 family)
MATDYIEKLPAGYYIIGTRITIDTVVQAFLNGDSPETIRQSYPSLTLEQVYGAIIFYLGHRDEVKAAMEIDEAQRANLLQSYRKKEPALFRKLEEARRALQKQP